MQFKDFVDSTTFIFPLYTLTTSQSLLAMYTSSSQCLVTERDVLKRSRFVCQASIALYQDMTYQDSGSEGLTIPYRYLTTYTFMANTC